MDAISGFIAGSVAGFFFGIWARHDDEGQRARRAFDLDWAALNDELGRINSVRATFGRQPLERLRYAELRRQAINGARSAAIEHLIKAQYWIEATDGPRWPDDKDPAQPRRDGAT